LKIEEISVTNCIVWQWWKEIGRQIRICIEVCSSGY
jgi:hypothetical protein